MPTSHAGQARRTWWRQFGQLYAVALFCTTLVALFSGFISGRMTATGYSGEAGDGIYTDPLAPPADASAALLLQAEDALLHGRFDEAVQVAEQALGTDPASEPAAAIRVNALFERYWATQSVADREAGRAALEQIPSPGTAQGYAARGNMSFIDGDVDAAVGYLRQAIGVDPGNAYAQHQLGYMLEAAGQTEEALLHFQQALSIAPTMAWVQENLGSALARLGRCDDYVSGLQSSIVASCHNQMGVERFNAGDAEGARFRFQTAVNLEPSSGTFHANLAGALYSLGAREQAIGEAQQARALGVTENWVYTELGM